MLALLGVAMMRLGGVQNTTSIFALQGARAYQAAQSGLEWGASRATGGNCVASSPMTIAGFTVTVDCSSSQFREGSGPAYTVYRLSSVAELGSYGSVDYVKRKVEAKVKLP